MGIKEFPSLSLTWQGLERACKAKGVVQPPTLLLTQMIREDLGKGSNVAQFDLWQRYLLEVLGKLC